MVRLNSLQVSEPAHDTGTPKMAGNRAYITEDTFKNVGGSYPCLLQEVDY